MSALEEKLDPLYHFSTHYPDRLSLLDASYTTNNVADKKSSKSRIARRKNNPRYKTQPITFDEIKEVEEPATTPSTEEANSKNSFLNQFQERSGKVDNRLHPHKFEVNADVIHSDAPNTDLWYDCRFPTKLSFLDMPEMTHHKPAQKGLLDKKSAIKNRSARRRNNPRYKTQPITFDEIKEVEEPENGNNNENGSSPNVTEKAFTPSVDTPIVQCTFVH